MSFSTPKSFLKGLIWPAMPSQQGSSLLAMQYQFEQSQWWSAELLRNQQFKQLENLVDHAFNTVPYYQESFKTAGFIPGTSALKDVWSGIPILKREQIQQAGDLLKSKEIPSQHGKTFSIWTSGSTGSPIRVIGTGVTSFLWKALTLREHTWHRRDLSATLAAIRYFAEDIALGPDGVSEKIWGQATGQVYDTGDCQILNIKTPIDIQADWLIRHDPEYLLTFPSNLQALAKYFIEKDLKLSNLRGVSTLSETLGSDVRDMVRQAWGVGLQDMYSTQEAGYLAIQCPEHEHYHVQAENIFLEVLNDDDEPCKAGEVGRVIVSTLHNFATPLIRYETGDYAEVGETCPCGRGLPVLKRILGRSRNMVTMPTGEQHWPVLGFMKYKDVIEIKHMQVIQHSTEELELKLVVNENVTLEQEQKFGKIIQTSIGYPFRIRFTYVDEIPRGKNGKFEEFISNL